LQLLVPTPPAVLKTSSTTCVPSILSLASMGLLILHIKELHEVLDSFRGIECQAWVELAGVAKVEAYNVRYSFTCKPHIYGVI
jgi:hypothetical protein